jgi:hypothetical protein
VTQERPVDAMANEFRAMCAELVDSVELLMGEDCEYVGVSAPIEPHGSYIYLRVSHTHWLPANALPTPTPEAS